MKFADRKNRLKHIVENVQLTTECPLLHETRVNIEHFARLKSAVIYYTYVSLTSNFPTEPFEISTDLFDRYEAHISKLANVTPNGLILPKRENYLAYHEIHKCIADILDSYQLGEKIRLIHAPVNIRLVRRSGMAADQRPKASTKLHTDIWAGEFSNSLMVFIPLLGDIDNIGVEFYEPPEDFYPAFVRVLDDYSEGAHFLERSEKYSCPLRNGYFYAMDPFLLHKTFKNADGWRLSLDFRFLPYEALESDLSLPSKRNENYIPYELWKSLGYTQLLYSEMPIDKFDDTRDKNAYAGRYEIRSLK